jgi:hypothetical protein
MITSTCHDFAQKMCGILPNYEKSDAADYLLGYMLQL